MKTALTLPRYLRDCIRKALRSFPVVVVTGARQTGKSTLIAKLLEPSRTYRTLDDLELLERARSDPDALLGSADRLTLDEIQRSPDLLLAIKRAVDRERRPGQFLLSGSANLALLGKVSETLAGRAIYQVLYPFTTAERAGLGQAGAWTALFEEPGQLADQHGVPREWDSDLLAGGFPPAALEPSPEARRAWFAGYTSTYLERDLQAMAHIENLVDFRRLMKLAALRSGGIVNQTEMARDAGMSLATVHRYLNLLETSYLLHRLPAYSVNRSKRLIKSPRLFLTDSGLAAHLAGLESPRELHRANMLGALLETRVLSELLAWREAETGRPEVLYWRTTSGEEVDFVIEWKGRLLPIEVKSQPRVRPADLKHLKAFLREYGSDAPHGLLLYTGTRTERVADAIWAIPMTVAFGLADRRQSGAGAKTRSR